ncbi:MAG: DUF2207 domain-containing protein, partial [bacterium]
MVIAKSVSRFMLRACLSVGLSLGLMQVAHAEVVRDFRSDITINQDGSALITETILYDFESANRHGIFRDIPIVNKAVSGKYYNYSLTPGTLTRDGSSLPTSVSQSGVNTRIMMGQTTDPTITGLHTYVIGYTIRPVIRKDEAGDYFNWNIIGDEWEVPIEKASATIHFPSTAPPLNTNLRCYTGARGSTLQNCQITIIGNDVSVTSSQTLTQFEGMTVNALTNANSFSAYQIEEDKPVAGADSSNSLASIGLALLLFIIAPVTLVVVGFILIRNYLRVRKLRSNTTVVAQYESPDSLSPAQLGLMTDNTMGMSEITATLIDLAVRGYIKINYIEAQGVFHTKDYVFVSLKPADASTRPYEAKLLSALFVGGVKEIQLSVVDPTAMSEVVDSIRKDLMADLTQRGYFAQKQKALNNADNVTSQGYTEWAKVEGFKLFLKVTEKDRLAFTDAPAKTPAMFSKFLPYAIALGVEKEWGKQFESMDLGKTTDWYNDPTQHGFSSVYLANSLSTSFVSSIASGFVPASSGG